MDETDCSGNLFEAKLYNILHINMMLRLFLKCKSYHCLIIYLLSLNSRLIKIEKEHDIKTRWSPTDQQYISSLTTQECVNAKQTLDMLLVSGRRRWFLLSLKKKYSGSFLSCLVCFQLRVFFYQSVI